MMHTTLPSTALRAGVSQSVIEVFGTMVGLELEALAPSMTISHFGERVVASVGFAGSVAGMVCINVSAETSSLLAAQMLGIELAELSSPEDENDAIGELTNVVAGNIKPHLTATPALCSLSVPSIMRGIRIDVEGISSALHEHFIFSNGAHFVQLELYLKPTSIPL